MAQFGEVFDLYDETMVGEISCKAFSDMYEKLRPPGIRLAQVRNLHHFCLSYSK